MPQFTQLYKYDTYIFLAPKSSGNPRSVAHENKKVLQSQICLQFQVVNKWMENLGD